MLKGNSCASLCAHQELHLLGSQPSSHRAEWVLRDRLWWFQHTGNCPLSLPLHALPNNP